MAKQSIPTEQELETLLSNWQPTPGAAFEERMARMPWVKERPPQISWQKFLLVGMAAAAILLLTFGMLQATRHYGEPVTFSPSPSSVTQQTLTPEPTKQAAYTPTVIGMYIPAPAQTPEGTGVPDES